MHAVVYAAVNALLVAIWLLTTGSTEELREILDRPTDALDYGFWPVWPILAWGAALVIHAGVAVVTLPRRTHRAILQARAAPTRRSVQRAPTPEPQTARRKRWVVVMFTDVCNSTTENERLGDDLWHGILARYRAVVRSAIESRGGKEIATAGDGFLICFDSPSDAVLAGVDIQRALIDERARDANAPHARIGLHAGDVVDDGTDVLGHVVNLASRVSAVAEADEILVTEPVADHLIGSLRVEDRGLQPLKGVSQPRHLLAVRWDS